MVVISQCGPVSFGAPHARRRRSRSTDSAVIDEARAAAQQVGDQLKDKAGEAASELKSSAQESAERVKEEAPTSSATMRDGTHDGPSHLNRRARHDTGQSCCVAAAGPDRETRQHLRGHLEVDCLPTG